MSRELRSLSERLATQWDVLCEFTSQTTDMMVPSRLHLDAQHLVREAVANAVRHAEAKSVRVTLGGTREAIHLEMINDGAAYPKRGGQIELPLSLRERVEQAGGAIEISRGMDVTKLSISLPTAGRGQ